MDEPALRPNPKQLAKLVALFRRFGKNWFRCKDLTADIARSVGLAGKTPEASLQRDLFKGLKPFLDHESQKHRLSQRTLKMLASLGHTSPRPRPRQHAASATTYTASAPAQPASSAPAPLPISRAISASVLIPRASPAHANVSISPEVPDANPAILLFKFVLMVLNTQFGKTYESIDDLSKTFALDKAENKNSLTIICTQNTLLSSAQFTARVQKLTELHGRRAVCVIASQTKTSLPTFKNFGGLIADCLMNASSKPRVIVVCSNGTRFDEIIPIVRFWKETRKETRSVHLVFDEIHKYINQRSGALRKIIERCHEHEFAMVKTITGLTATPARVFHETVTSPWSELRLRHLKLYNDENYYYTKEMAFIQHPPIDKATGYTLPEYVHGTRFTKDADNGSIGVFRFVEGVLGEHPNILACEGGKRPPRVLIPGHRNTVSHNLVRELVWRYNPEALVVIINGQDKAAFVNQKAADGEYVKYPLAFGDDGFPAHLKGIEACEVLAYQLKKHNLLNRAIVFTGNICIGMGQTLCHSDYGNMSDEILAPEAHTTPDDRYQASGRGNARCKHWDTFVETRIHTTKDVYDSILGMEERSTNVARLFSTEVGRTITFGDYRDATDSQSSDTKHNPRSGEPSVRTTPTPAVSPSSYRIYNKREDLAEAVLRMGWRKPVFKAANADGFHETTLNGRQQVASLVQAIAKVPSGWGGSYPGAKKAMRTFYPCYVDVTDSSTLRFVLIIRPKDNGKHYTEEELKDKLGPLYNAGEPGSTTN
jgi:hypothetical protein